MLATAREAKTIADLAELGIETLSLVVDDAESVKECFNDVETRLGDKGLDYLVNNAYEFSDFFLSLISIYFEYFQLTTLYISSGRSMFKSSIIFQSCEVAAAHKCHRLHRSSYGGRDS